MNIAHLLASAAIGIALFPAPSSAATKSNFYNPLESPAIGGLPSRVRVALSCIAYAESRDHLNDGAANQGLFQFARSTWDDVARVFRVSFNPRGHVWANHDSGARQCRFAVYLWHHQGYQPWTTAAGCDV